MLMGNGCANATVFNDQIQFAFAQQKNKKIREKNTKCDHLISRVLTQPTVGVGNQSCKLLNILTDIYILYICNVIYLSTMALLNVILSYV